VRIGNWPVSFLGVDFVGLGSVERLLVGARAEILRGFWVDCEDDVFGLFEEWIAGGPLARASWD